MKKLIKLYINFEACDDHGISDVQERELRILITKTF